MICNLFLPAIVEFSITKPLRRIRLGNIPASLLRRAAYRPANSHSEMKKLIILFTLLAAGFFALAKWSPKTVERIMFWKRTAPQIVSPQNLPEPAPALSASKPEEDAVPPAPSADARVVVDKTAQVVVLLYHRIEPSAQTAGDLNVSPEVFEQHMQRLKDEGISVISMSDFLAWRRGEKSIPSRSAIITIDDGYVSAFDTARPILKKFGYPWTYFIYTKYVGSGGKSITWEQLGQLRDEGVEIGCHTVSHQDLRDPRGKTPEAYEQWLRDEIAGSKTIIEQHLGIRCTAFAYPFGGWNSRIVQIVREAGYAAAFTVYGQRITHSAPSEKIGRYAWSSRRPQDIELALKFIGPLSSTEPGPTPPPSSATANTLLTQPLDGETIADPQPTLKVNLSQIEGIEPSSVSVRLSGIGLVPHKYDSSTHLLESRPPEPLTPGEYTVTISGKAGSKRVETRWRFTIAQKTASGP